MSSLRELQESLQAYLLRNEQSIAKHIIKPKQDIIDARLEIYREHYYISLTDILKKSYENLYRLLGEESFEELSVAYIKAYPSQYYNINEFTQHLPIFLREHKLYAQHLYIAELAEFIYELENTLIKAD